MEASSMDRTPPGLPPARPERDPDGFRRADAHEQRLIRSIAAGDAKAFRELYVGYHVRLARFLMRLTRRYDVAEEIINDTLWVVWRKAGEFRGGSKVSTWIMSIAYRRALKTLRQLNPGANVQSLDEDTTVPTEATVGDDSGDLHDWIDRALARLPAEQRLVIELTYYQGLSCVEVALVTDCPVNTVKTRMFHARRKLRALLPLLDGSREAAAP